MEKVIERILRAYGLDYACILAPQKGYRNQSWPVELTSGETINLILYKSEPGILHRILAANSISNFLNEQGFPTRLSKDKIITLQAGAYRKYGALYNYLPGATIPWEAYTMARLKNLGAIMSNMHACLRSYEGSLPDVIDEYDQIAQRMTWYFEQEVVATAMHKKLRLRVTAPHHLRQVLNISRQLPAQALHMDFVRGNILFSDEKIVGILDFEKTAHGPRVFDVARTLAFLLVDCKHKDEAKVRKYFLASGYNKRGSLLFADTTFRHQGHRQSLLEGLIDLFLLYDLYKFLRHNPYESLAQNEHFIRTRNLLVRRQVIAYNESIGRVVTRG